MPLNHLMILKYEGWHEHKLYQTNEEEKLSQGE